MNQQGWCSARALNKSIVRQNLIKQRKIDSNPGGKSACEQQKLSRYHHLAQRRAFMRLPLEERHHLELIN